jgi:hypothetical protein
MTSATGTRHTRRRSGSRATSSKSGAALPSDDYDAGLPHCVERIAALSNPLEDLSQYQ